MNDNTIFIFDAHAGMKLSRDIILSDGSLLAPKDTVLTPSLIAKISSLHVLEINIIMRRKTLQHRLKEMLL